MASQSSKTGSDNILKAAEDKQMENEEQFKIPEISSDDAELDDLLDNALEDFGKVSACNGPNVRQTIQGNDESVSHTSDLSSSDTDGAISNTDGATADSINPSQEALFNKLFSEISNQQSDSKSMEEMLLSFMAVDQNKFKDLDCAPESAEAGGDIADTLQQTLGSLAQNMQELQSDNISEEEIMKMMSSLGLEGADGSKEDDLFPMMQGMMRNLLSKDVLYPSLKEISSQYPKWFEENENKVDDADLQKYKKQHQLMSTIIGEYDEEQESDSEEVKRRRFDRILDVMQQMQELGQPPKDIVGELPKDIEFDEDGLPKFPTGLFPSGTLPSADQCQIM